MSDNLVLEHLRHLRSDLAGLRDDVRELKHRITGVELAIAALRRDNAAQAESDAHLSARMDRQGERLERIERRLDIA